MNLVGIYASQMSGHLFPWTTSDYESISTVTVSSNQTSITFSSIPSTYKHLQIRAIVKTDFTTYPNDSMLMQFNGVTSSSFYYTHQMYNNSGGVGSQNFNASGLGVAYVTGTNGNANTFGNSIIDVLDYTSTSKNKTIRSITGWAGGLNNLNSGLWFSTPAAVTSILLKPNDGTNFVPYSSFALYGIKG